MGETEPEPRELSRRTFIKSSAGVATGAAIAVTPAAIALQDASAAEAREVVHKPSPTPSEPVMAYVRDAKRGEVTVLSGTNEATYRDRALVKRMLDAAADEGSSGKRGRR
jgi:hypothetical protein